jgi:hypothetical protein
MIYNHKVYVVGCEGAFSFFEFGCRDTAVARIPQDRAEAE